MSTPQQIIDRIQDVASEILADCNCQDMVAHARIQKRMLDLTAQAYTSGFESAKRIAEQSAAHSILTGIKQ